MATGVIKFIFGDNEDAAIVLEDYYHKIIKSSSLATKSNGESITYTYDSASASNDGHNVTIA